MRRGGATALLFVTLAAILGAVLARMRGPEPLPASAPAAAFSAARAATYERAILGGDALHPVGTAAHDAVRDRLAAQLRNLGYNVTVQRGFACSPAATCAPVTNVIARTPSDHRNNALLLAAHYDSQAASYGVSDDGIGVAALVETARALRSERFRNPIVYLITDAEEVALLGAEAFAGDATLRAGYAAVINVEARGTSGASYLFETSRRNAWLARVIAQALPRPATSSLYYDIYELLPNDTDLTVFKRAGLAGVGFANIGRPVQYHTPLDSFANLDLSTLQHHGDHLLAMARALAASDLRQTSRGNAVWFDVLSLFVVWWPQEMSLALAALALAVLLLAAYLLVRGGKTTARAITIGVSSFVATLIFALIAGYASNWIAGLRTAGAVWVAQPGPAIAAAWLIGIATALWIAHRLVRPAGNDGLFLGHALCWAAMAIALCLALPGASYLGIVPALACAIGALLRASGRASTAAVAIGCAAVAAVLIFPLGIAFYDALGRPILPFLAVLIALVTTTFAPFVAAAPDPRRALMTSIAAAALACVAMAIVVPAYTAASPRHMNVEYIDDDGAPRWQADAMQPAVAAAAPFGKTSQVVSEWLATPPRAFIAPAPALGFPTAELRVLRDDRAAGRHLTLELRSRRDAPRVTLLFRAASFTALRVDGITPPPRTRGRTPFGAGWHRASVRGASQMTVDIDLQRNEAIDAIVVDSSYGLPPAGAALAHARDTSLAVPVHDGDLTTTMRRLRL